jgi:hypothetical protein
MKKPISWSILGAAKGSISWWAKHLRKEFPMPGKSVKDWDKYHALRRKGMSKTRAAKIANSGKSGKR